MDSTFNQNQKEMNQNTETNIKEYLNLYPPLLCINENNKYNNNVPYIEWDFDSEKKDKESSNQEVNKNIYEMNTEFLESLLQRKSNFDKNKIVNTMCNFIKNSKLIKKLESETSDKKSDMQNLVFNCAKNLGYVKLEKGKVLFRIGDIGDKFYFILKGKISVLKLKELKNIYMTNVEYLQYCIFLIKNKEDYILNEVFKKNKKYFDIINTEDIIKIYRIVCIKILREKIADHIITNNAQLLNFFSEYNLELSSFHITESDLNNLENQKEQDDYNTAKDWENYILKKVRPSIKESIFFEEYEQIFKDRERKYNIICYVYEAFLYFGPGLFFGDFALDSEISKRNGTIRAEEKTYLGWMKGLDYANIIAPRRKIEKYNEIMFLFKNFFFKKINVFTFEKKYFHLFPPREFIKGEIMHYQNIMPNSLYFVKTGQIEIEIKVSVFELQYIIEQIFERMVKNKYYKKAFREKGANYLVDIDAYKRIKNLIKEPYLEKIRDKNARFLAELNKRINYKLTIITERELIGIEEMFLGIGYLTTGKVISDKVNCYELSENQLNTLLEEEKSIILLYTKYSVNKILQLIDKLQNLRKNRIYSTRNKFENIHVPPEDEMEKTSDKKEDKNEIFGKAIEEKKKENNEEKEENEENKDEQNKEQINSISNRNKQEFGSNYPLTKEAKLNIKKILLEKYPEKVSKKKDRLINSIMKEKLRKNAITNQKKIIKKKNYSFFNDLKEDKKSQENPFNNILKYSIPEVKNKKENAYFIGNTCININKIKQEINECNFNLNDNTNIKCDNAIFNSSNLRNDPFSQIFELSQLRYPFTNRKESINDDINYNSESGYRISRDNNNNSSFLNNLNEFKESEKNYFVKRAKTISQINQKYFKKVKKRNIGNNTTITGSLILSGNKSQIYGQSNIIDLNQEDNTKNKRAIINKKDLLPKIIKEFDNKMKDRVINSYVNKGNKNKNKKEKIFNINELSDILPLILLKK